MGLFNSFDPESDIPDLAGKTVLVTGGNNGIGKAAVTELAKHNAKVYMGARSQEKAEAAIADIKLTVPNANITFLELDLASFESVKNAADHVLAENDRLDILMNNAGIMAVPPGLTKDGYEIQFGTNHLGHALLTKLLRPLLTRTSERAATNVCVINVTSDGQESFAPPEGLLLDEVKTDMAGRGGFVVYGHSKLANVYFTKGMAKHFPGIRSVAVHPGYVSTGLAGGVSYGGVLRHFKPVISGLVKVALTTPERGAYNQLWACVSPKARSGAVFYPVGKEHKGRPLMNNPDMVDKLWDWTENELKERGY